MKLNVFRERLVYEALNYCPWMDLSISMYYIVYIRFVEKTYITLIMWRAQIIHVSYEKNANIWLRYGTATIHIEISENYNLGWLFDANCSLELANRLFAAGIAEVHSWKFLVNMSNPDSLVQQQEYFGSWVSWSGTARPLPIINIRVNPPV